MSSGRCAPTYIRAVAVTADAAYSATAAGPTLDDRHGERDGGVARREAQCTLFLPEDANIGQVTRGPAPAHQRFHQLDARPDHGAARDDRAAATKTVTPSVTTGSIVAKVGREAEVLATVDHHTSTSSFCCRGLSFSRSQSTSSNASSKSSAYSMSPNPSKSRCAVTQPPFEHELARVFQAAGQPLDLLIDRHPVLLGAKAKRVWAGVECPQRTNGSVPSSSNSTKLEQRFLADATPFDEGIAATAAGYRSSVKR